MKKSASSESGEQGQPPPENSSDRRLSDSVYERLLEMILSGQLEAGKPISELELTRVLNVSRTPVHEAVGLLIKDGLIVQTPNRRPSITAFSPEEIFDIYEMRRILESEAAAKAATRMDRQTMVFLRECAEGFRNSQGSPDVMTRWVDFDDVFHASIAGSTGSRRLEEDILRYRRLHRVFNRVHVDPSVLVYGLQEHLQILEALEKRDADAARLAMYNHLLEWQRFFVRMLGTSA